MIRMKRKIPFLEHSLVLSKIGITSDSRKDSGHEQD